MPRCKHLNVEVGESTPRHMTHVFANGKYAESIGGEYGSTDKVYTIECKDCGLVKDFNKNNKNNPAWAKRYIDHITMPWTRED